MAKPRATYSTTNVFALLGQLMTVSHIQRQHDRQGRANSVWLGRRWTGSNLRVQEVYANLVYLSLRKPETSSTPPLVQDHVLLCHIRYSQYCMYINVGFHIHIRWEMGSTIQTILQENLYKCSKRDFVQWFPKCSTLYGTLMTWSKSSLTSLTALF